MAVYCVSDIHGCKKEFDQLLEQIHFTEYDEMYIIGDIVDRGRNPIPLLRQIMAAPNMHMLMGNHDELFRRFIDAMILEKRIPGSTRMDDDLLRWLHHDGGITTLDQFMDLPLPVCYDIKLFLDQQPYYKRLQLGTEKFLLVHAGFREHFMAGVSPAEVPTQELIWSHIGLDDNPFYDTWMVVGHTPTGVYDSAFDGRIIRRPHSHLYHIDCGCVYGRNLGCLRLNDFQEFYVPMERAHKKS